MPPPLAIQGNSSVQQGLSAAYESIAFCKHRRGADKRYLLGVMIPIDFTAREPETREALRSVIAFLARNSFALRPEQMRVGDELKRRLERLESDCNRLIKINNVLMQAELPQVVHDEATDTLTMTVGDNSHSIKITRADPNIPVKLVSSTAVRTYVPGRDDHSSKPKVEELKVLFESLLEKTFTTHSASRRYCRI